MTPKPISPHGRSRRWAWLVLLGLLLPLFLFTLPHFAQAIPTNVLHISASTGNDFLTCGAALEPCQTIQYALHYRANPSDTLLIARLYPHRTPQAVDVVVEKQQWPTGGAVAFTLPKPLFEAWLAAGALGENIRVLTVTHQVRLLGEGTSSLRGLPLQPAETIPLTLDFAGPAGVNYALHVREEIHGMVMGGVSYRWVVENSPPTLVSAVPAPNSTAVPRTIPLVLTFSGLMAPESLELQANPPLGAWQAAWSEGDTVATIAHAPLLGLTPYMVQVMAYDQHGLPLAEPIPWGFCTAAQLYLPLIMR